MVAILTDCDVITAVVHFLGVKDANFCKEGIRMLHDHCTKSVNVGGDSLANVLGFLKLTPPTLGHELINHPS